MLVVCVNVLWSVGVYCSIEFGSWYCIGVLILVWVNVVSCNVFFVGWVILLFNLQLVFIVGCYLCIIIDCVECFTGVLLFFNDTLLA